MRAARHAGGLRRLSAGGACGENLHRNQREQLGRGLEWGVIAEDLPDDTNYVALDAALTDSDGVPAPKLIYKNSENTQRADRFHSIVAKEANAGGRCG